KRFQEHRRMPIIPHHAAKVNGASSECSIMPWMEDNGLPSRTSILTAAARALGSREPDVSVRNPDWAADRLIGPAELALIADRPISAALGRDLTEALDDIRVL